MEKKSVSSGTLSGTYKAAALKKKKRKLIKRRQLFDIASPSYFMTSSVSKH